jgi:hypothetical protein
MRLYFYNKKTIKNQKLRKWQYLPVCYFKWIFARPVLSVAWLLDVPFLWHCKACEFRSDMHL